MRAESNIQQEQVRVDKLGDRAIITLMVEEQQEQRESVEGIVETIYTYDTYTLDVPYSTNLEASIRDEIEMWVQRAKLQEKVIGVTTEERLEAIEEVINDILGL